MKEAKRKPEFCRVLIGRKCLVCGHQITKGYVHDKCKLDPRYTNPIHWFQKMCGRLDRVNEELERRIKGKMRVWSKNMGIEERNTLFPDLKGRD